MVNYQKLSFTVILSILSGFLLGFGQPEVKKVCIKDVCIETEVAETPQQRIRGLMFREDLEGNKGMLFIFAQETRPSFWMRNMNFPLDIIWISSDKIITDIYQNVSPCQEACPGITPRLPVKFAIEVRAGFVEKNQVRVGDKVVF